MLANFSYIWSSSTVLIDRYTHCFSHFDKQIVSVLHIFDFFWLLLLLLLAKWYCSKSFSQGERELGNWLFVHIEWVSPRDEAKKKQLRDSFCFDGQPQFILNIVSFDVFDFNVKINASFAIAIGGTMANLHVHCSWSWKCQVWKSQLANGMVRM